MREGLTMGLMQVFPSYVLSRQTELLVDARPTAPDCGAKDIIKVTAPATEQSKFCRIRIV